MYDGPQFRPVAPPQGVAEPTASVWCGTPGHPRSVIRARHERVLPRLERAWRCAACGRGDWTLT